MGIRGRDRGGERQRERQRAHTNDLPLSNKQGQLILALLGQLAQLDTTHFRADVGREVVDDGLALGEQIRERRVSILAVVVVLKGLEGRISLRLVVPHGQVMGEGGRRLFGGALQFILETELFRVADALLLVEAGVILESLFYWRRSPEGDGLR